MYRAGLADIAGLAFRPSAEWAEVVSWLEPVRVLPESGISRDELVRRLRANGIDARALWTPLVDLPPYRQWCAEREISTPVARRLLSELLWLPTYSAMRDDQVEMVVQEVHKAMEAV
jgi:perosamine synthetase